MDRLTIAADHFLAIRPQMSTEDALRHTMQRYGVYERQELLDAIRALSDSRHEFSLVPA